MPTRLRSLVTLAAEQVYPALVVYCARHTFGTAADEGNRKSRDVHECHGPHGCAYRNAVPAPGVGFGSREAIDQRNLRTNHVTTSCEYSEDGGK